MRGLAFLGAVLLAGPALAAEPPAALAPYVEDGSLRAGYYGWARGAFDGADPQDKAAYESIVVWRDTCSEEAREELQTELAALGASLSDGDDTHYGGSQLCRTAFPPKLEAFSDFAQLEAASARVTPLFISYMAAAEGAQNFSRSNATTLGERLRARMLGDVLLRQALVLVWNREGPFAGLSDAESAVADALVTGVVLAQDLAHTEWLDAHVAEHGWPTISEVGEGGARAAWLLAQHADLDPAFQLRASVGLGPLADHVDAMNESGGPC